MPDNHEIPARLLAALKKIEEGGMVPLLIPAQLEKFLTDQGLFSGSMTPEIAWRTLQDYAREQGVDLSQVALLEEQRSEVRGQRSENSEPAQKGEAEPVKETEREPNRGGLLGRLRGRNKG